MKTITIVCMAVLLLILSTVSCTPQEVKEPPDEVTVQLKWIHQAQFAGLYAAQEKGYYAEENIKVSFIEGGPGIDRIEALISGQVDFIIDSPETLIINSSQGIPLVAIAAIYRQSAAVFVSMADSGIIRPFDFLDKKIAVLDNQAYEIQLFSLIKKLGLDLSRMNLKSFDSEYVEFYNGDVDITPSYLTGGVSKMRELGHDINIIFPSDYGIHFYSDILVTTENMISQDPDLVTRFLRATLKGWKDAIGDTESAIETTLEYAAIKDPELQSTMMESQVPLIHTGEDHIGWMKDEEWQMMYDILLEQKIIDTPLDYKELYTMEFLNIIYGGK